MAENVGQQWNLRFDRAQQRYERFQACVDRKVGPEGPIILIIIMMLFCRGIPKHPRAWMPNRCTYMYARDQYSVLSPENTHDSP